MKETLDKYVAEGWLISQRHPTLPLTIYNYSQETQFEKHWDEITLMCRGLVVDDTGVIVARPFKKFFNWEEIIHSVDPAQLKMDFEVFDKMDGCCHEDTIIDTEDGKKTIKEICESNFRGAVLSYNINKNLYEYKNVSATSILEDNNDWYEIEMESGEKIKLTGNHKVWLPILKCYRRVEDLKGDEEFLLNKNLFEK